MPHDLGKPPITKRVSIPKYSGGSIPESELNLHSLRSELEGDSSLPLVIRGRLHDLFSQIEKEFETLYAENISLQEKVDILSEKLERESLVNEKPGFDYTDFDVPTKVSKHKLGSSSQKLKTAHKLKAQTSKIVSSFKGPTVGCNLVREFTGHRDGVWEVAVARPGQPIIGTASADHRACIWGVDSGKCLLQYLGHQGSVNSLRFHPLRDLVLTSSGDHKAHVWQAAVNWEASKGNSDSEELEDFRGGGGGEGESEQGEQLRTPLVELTGHASVVMSADWLAGGDQAVTASWDRTASLYDVETGEMLQTLSGHDQELTHTSAHHSQRLVVTSSRDTTFRLWDFREPIHSVSVFQGHTDTVTCAVFTKREDKVVSGSDDRSVKVWDLRNMRSPLATIRSDSAVNRLDVSNTGVVAIPHDNRQVRLYDLGGQRIARLPRTNRQGHQRMVCCVTWVDDNSLSMPCNFFSCGFDRLVLGWNIQSVKDT
ncbi:WD repeat-containing protein 37 isoform X2 [Macrosteles quadrilineatus]|uniref:WD repeat-containing protein 37 isoform X2 n=1 Tax=Macrosteles quadrilineatus TaxID=74068 RepID=UPI0023E34FBF|nr:WD repeat-containing protein 37 isoform X2 [Macrosteles quadrilineatus]